MGGSGNTELFGHINVATLRATGDIVHAANQGFEKMVARLTMIFVDRHNEESSKFRRACCARPHIMVFWAAQDDLSMRAGAGLTCLST